MITNDIADAVLQRTEISRIGSIEFRATVPFSSSGISFGRIQIDIATNQYGQEQFGDILAAGGLSFDCIARLSEYVGVRSRNYSADLDEGLPGALS